MHSLTPPHQSLQLVIPSSDAKPPIFDFKSKRPPYGLETPPPSAHDESRRESFHSLSDLALSTGASARPRSDPCTPIHQIIHGWSDLNMCGTTGVSRHSDQHLLSPGYSSHVYRTPTANAFPPVYQQLPPPLCTNTHPLHLNTGLNAVEPWTGAPVPTTAFDNSMAFLGQELFPVTQGLSLGNSFTAPSLHHAESSLQGHVSMNEHDRGLAPGLLYNEPHIMELAHVDHYDHSQLEYASFEEDEVTMSRSFESSGTVYGFEYLRAPSPMADYMDECSEGEGLMIVKTERTRPENKVHRSTASKTRPSKSRKKRQPAWHEHETAGIKVSCVGPRFDPLRPESYAQSKESKQHGCTFFKKNGERCTARFKRSEHLKRHVGSHTGERSFRCPIKECVKNKPDNGIQRGDNATDHFKTHLRPPKGGKRNCHVEWEWLEPAIREMWADQKRAKKIINNIQGWINKGMPETSSRRNPE